MQSGHGARSQKGLTGMTQNHKATVKLLKKKTKTKTLPDVFHSKSSNVKEELCEGTYEFRSGFKKCFVGKMLELYFMKRSG